MMTGGNSKTSKRCTKFKIIFQDPLQGLEKKNPLINCVPPVNQLDEKGQETRSSKPSLGGVVGKITAYRQKKAYQMTKI